MTTIEDFPALLSRLRELHIEIGNLRVEEETIITTIEEIHNNTSNQKNHQLQVVQPNTISPRSTDSNKKKIINKNNKPYRFKSGDRVRIKNLKINDSTSEGDILAKVTKVSLLSDRIYFITDNGNSTYRASKNLELIDSNN